MIDPRKAALIIIDMQHGFLDSSSALCVAGAAATVPACTRALNRARELGMPVFHAIREYAADGSDVEAARHRGWVEGGKPVSRACASPRTLDEYEPLAPQPGDRVIAKPRFSAFFATQLDLVLRRLGVGTVVLIGTTTPNCIRTTCYDALSLDYNVAVIEDCTSSRTPAIWPISGNAALRAAASAAARPSFHKMAGRITSPPLSSSTAPCICPDRPIPLTPDRS